MEHRHKAMHVVIVDTGLGSTTRHYYVLSGNRGGNEYVYNLAHLNTALVSTLPKDMFFRHTTSDCRGPAGDSGDSVTHFAVIAIDDMILISE